MLQQAALYFFDGNQIFDLMRLQVLGAFCGWAILGGRGGGRTHTKSELRQILSLVRLPVPPLGHYWHARSLTSRQCLCLHSRMSFLDLLLGKPLANWEETGERIGPAAGIPIFGLDALSSAAYGPEAAL